MRKVIIDGEEIEVPPHLTLLQACEVAGREIPRFCYHERLSIAGNCRMCLVEWVGAPKPQASCALSVGDLRPDRDGSPPKIRTNSAVVKKAREGVMEFLLINHPLDCPICDQGGECDLQDQAMAYGVAGSRFQMNKRAVQDKNMGPLVKTSMTRCIQCTRCVRFATEVAGVPDLGATGRGEDMEITTYLEKAFASELSGNVIDLCPVGALTSKPYAFAARPWELRKTETIDVMDAIGSNIRVDVRGGEVMRIMPRLNEEVNEEWISDKSRFVWDGLRRQRLDQPYVRSDGKLRPASWDEAFAAIAAKVEASAPERVAAIVGDLAACEEMKALKDLMAGLGTPHLDCRQDGAKIGAGARGAYVFNPGLAGVEDADAILLIGTNPRVEAPVLNARIRKAWLANRTPIGVIGPRADLTYDHAYLGAGPKSLAELIRGDGEFHAVLERAERPLIMLGAGALAREDGAAIHAAAAKLAGAIGAISEDWAGFAVLHAAASRVGGLDLGLTPGEGGRDVAGILEGAGAGDIDLVWLLGADEIDMNALGSAFVVYQGSHGDAGAHRADVILPGAAYTEKSGTYVNTEGRPQGAFRAAFPPGEAREDWAILRAVSQRLGATLPYDDIASLRAAMYEDAPHLAALGVPAEAAWEAPSGTGEMDDAAFQSAVPDFWASNPIARASLTMAECSRVFATRAKEEAA